MAGEDAHRSGDCQGVKNMNHSILLPHDDAKHTGDAWICYVTTNITTIAEIGRVTGIDFLPGVTGTKRTALENFKALALWPKE